MAYTGLAQLLVLHRNVGNILLVVGVIYLALLGLQMMQQKPRSAATKNRAPDASLVGMALFQAMNPKSVILMATVAAATPDNATLFLLMAGMMALTAATCLVIWAMAGSTLSHWLLPPARRQTFDLSMGLLLIVSAIMLLFYGWGEMA